MSNPEMNDASQPSGAGTRAFSLALRQAGTGMTNPNPNLVNRTVTLEQGDSTITRDLVNKAIESLGLPEGSQIAGLGYPRHPPQDLYSEESTARIVYRNRRSEADELAIDDPNFTAADYLVVKEAEDAAFGRQLQSGAISNTVALQSTDGNSSDLLDFGKFIVRHPIQALPANTQLVRHGAALNAHAKMLTRHDDFISENYNVGLDVSDLYGLDEERGKAIEDLRDEQAGFDCRLDDHDGNFRDYERRLRKQEARLAEQEKLLGKRASKIRGARAERHPLTDRQDRTRPAVSSEAEMVALRSELAMLRSENATLTSSVAKILLILHEAFTRPDMRAEERAHLVSLLGQITPSPGTGH